MSVAEWISAHPGSHMVCTVSRYGRRYFLVDDRTGEWFAWEQ